MDLDDLFSKKKSAAVQLGEDISRLSIPDLEERLAALAGERQRVEEEIHKRRASLSAAEDVFKRKP
ncbi:MAG: DUF1192 domain-containing protein [Hyphomicrobiaceae bacterium]